MIIAQLMGNTPLPPQDPEDEHRSPKSYFLIPRIKSHPAGIFRDKSSLVIYENKNPKCAPGGGAGTGFRGESGWGAQAAVAVGVPAPPTRSRLQTRFPR